MKGVFIPKSLLDVLAKRCSVFYLGSMISIPEGRIENRCCRLLLHATNPRSLWQCHLETI
ncbi:hypothetical protein FORC9_3393 [Vibrio vulnificus]|nr:hypothetical protein FORC9_3393 [Vibrio vulnificus]ANH65270.1 hypothetical protein FORC16_3387 [Vibrio vulnificus]